MTVPGTAEAGQYTRKASVLPSGVGVGIGIGIEMLDCCCRIHDAGWFCLVAPTIMLRQTAGSVSCAFFPLWPWVIHAGSYLTGGNHLVSGLILSNLLSLIGLILFYTLIHDNFGRSIADTGLLFLLVYPGAMFFQLLYSESLFFLLTIGLFWSLRKRWWTLAALMGFLLPLCRAVGLFLVLPLAIELILTGKWKRWFWSALSPVVGYATYLAFMYFSTGNAFEGMEAQSRYISNPHIGRLWDLPGFLHAAVRVGHVHGFMDSAIDRVFFLGSLMLLPRVRRSGWTMFAYAICIGVVPAILNWFMSYTRYLTMAFPVFVALATCFDGKHSGWRTRLLIMLASLQTVFLIWYTRSWWAG